MSLVRNTLTQSSLTMGSRILGFVRDILIAAKVGAGPIGDAFVTALILPNLFRRIFAEGAFAQAFVPAYARTLESDGKEAAEEVARQTMRGLFAVTAGLVILAQRGMPWLMYIFHGGYPSDSDSFQLAILLTRITMPYLACMALAALLSGVLNSAGRFVLSAGAPTLLNIFLITAALLGDTAPQTAVYAAWAVSFAGVAQAALLWWGVTRQKISLSLGLPKMTPAVRKIIALAIPGTIAASGTQINIMVSQLLASFEEGAKSWLFYADRLYQLPLGIVGVAVGVAILPRLARAARSDDSTSANTLMDDGIGLAMALTLPAAIARLRRCVDPRQLRRTGRARRIRRSPSASTTRTLWRSAGRTHALPRSSASGSSPAPASASLPHPDSTSSVVGTPGAAISSGSCTSRTSAWKRTPLRSVAERFTDPSSPTCSKSSGLGEVGGASKSIERSASAR